MKPPRPLPLLALALALHLPGAARAEVPIDEVAGSGISFEGLLQVDANWFDNDVADLAGNGRNAESDVRRAELVLKGKGPGRLDWVVGYDAHAERFLDTNLRYRLDQAHWLQAGQYKQPNSLEELSSTRHNDFISKATVTSTYALGRRLGVAAGSNAGHWAVTASAFGRELTRNQASGSGMALRATLAALQHRDRLLHLGLNLADYDTDADTLRLRARPNADLASVRLVDTGAMADTDRLRSIGAEAMYLQGPLKLQGEYVDARARRYHHRDHRSDGWYLSAVWNLGGEAWEYKAGVPGVPGTDAAAGLWQLGVRHDRIDLDDGRPGMPAADGGPAPADGVPGGTMSVWTIGANWYWRSNIKAAVNYVRVDSRRLDAGSGRWVDDDPSSVQARLQLHW